MSTAVELRDDAHRIRTFALSPSVSLHSEVLAELRAMIQELEHRARLLDDARERSS
jgi:hypothetical protein